MKILITGICGMIGSELARQCLKKKWEVIGVDNLSTGSLKNIKDIKDNRFFKLHVVNLANYSNLNNVFSKNLDIKYIFHLGALADIVPSIENPKSYYNSNVTGTINILEMMRIYKINKIIYAASSSCYGIPRKYPTNEDATINCKYPYSAFKWQAERMIRHYGLIYNISWISLRLFNVYSSKCKISNQYGAVLKVFAKQLLEDAPLTIVGNGNQKRDFVHVEDVARAFIESAKSKVNNEIFNVGNGNPVSINTLACLMFNLYHKKKICAEVKYPLPYLKYLPWRPGEPRITHADISKIKLCIGWKPRINIIKGIKEVIKNIDNYKDAPLWTEKDIKKATKSWFKCLG